MAFQKSVSFSQPLGIPGEFYDAAHPRRVTAWKLDNAEQSVGRVFTFNGEGNPVQGGSGVFAGILVHPKEHARLGLDANIAVRQGVSGGLADKGRIIVKTTAAAVLNGPVYYAVATGEIAGSAPDDGLTALPCARFIFVDAAADELAVVELN